MTQLSFICISLSGKMAVILALLPLSGLPACRNFWILFCYVKCPSQSSPSDRKPSIRRRCKIGIVASVLRLGIIVTRSLLILAPLSLPTCASCASEHGGKREGEFGRKGEGNLSRTQPPFPSLHRVRLHCVAYRNPDNQGRLSRVRPS